MYVTAEMLAAAKQRVARAARQINQVPASDETLREQRKRAWGRAQAEYERRIQAATNEVLIQHGSPLAMAELRRRD